MEDSIELIRARPGMYVGDVSEEGALNLACEVAANAIDQFLQGHATTVGVTIEGLSFEVSDDGAGLSKEKALRHLSRLHITPTADGHAPHVHLSTHGVGLCPVNALCSEFLLESRDYTLRFERGRLVEESERRKAAGTRVAATLDSDIVWAVALPYARLRRTLFEAVHHYPGLRLSLNRETFYSENGLIDLAEFEEAPARWAVHYPTHRLRFGHTGETADVRYNVACVGERGETQLVRSWVNGGPTVKHGSHVDGLQAALYEVGWHPSVVMIHAVMLEPTFAGPTKEKLLVEKVAPQLRAALAKPLRKFLKQH